jgi:hypothetical protein
LAAKGALAIVLADTGLKIFKMAKWPTVALRILDRAVCWRGSSTFLGRVFDSRAAELKSF